MFPSPLSLKETFPNPESITLYCMLGIVEAAAGSDGLKFGIKTIFDPVYVKSEADKYK